MPRRKRTQLEMEGMPKGAEVVTATEANRKLSVYLNSKEMEAVTAVIEELGCITVNDLIRGIAHGIYVVHMTPFGGVVDVIEAAGRMSTQSMRHYASHAPDEQVFKITKE